MDKACYPSTPAVQYRHLAISSADLTQALIDILRRRDQQLLPDSKWIPLAFLTENYLLDANSISIQPQMEHLRVRLCIQNQEGARTELVFPFISHRKPQSSQEQPHDNPLLIYLQEWIWMFLMEAIQRLRQQHWGDAEVRFDRFLLQNDELYLRFKEIL